MLEFAARDYIELTYEMGLLLGTLRGTTHKSTTTFTNQWQKLLDETYRLGLDVTREHMMQMTFEVIEENPGKMRVTEEGKLEFIDLQVDPSRLCHHLESLYVTLKAELRAIKLRAIPKDRSTYCDLEWLKTSPLSERFPTSLKELHRAGACYSIGEPTACVFHSMRALEPALNALANTFAVSFEHENWQKVIEQIEAKVRELGEHKKSPEKIADEKFFGAATSHLYFVKNAWRNHVAHTRDNYSDKEAFNIMDQTIQFIESLCARLTEPEP